jgi:S1-C subfamily serine protease
VAAPRARGVAAPRNHRAATPACAGSAQRYSERILSREVAMPEILLASSPVARFAWRLVASLSALCILLAAGTGAAAAQAESKSIGSGASRQGAAGVAPAAPTAPGGASRPAAASPLDSERFFSAVVRLDVKAVKGARSAASLGAERQGTGIVIGKDGLILTIGYLIVEADEIAITDGKGRSRPGTVVGYDHASGLGLVRSLAPLDATPLALGDSESLAEREPVMIVNHGGRDDVALAYVVSRRVFTGNWEYLVERAILTAPATMDWSGAALVGKEGTLLGVGSLILREVGVGELQMPGNMFVPVDLLKPILDDLVRQGRRAGPARPWLGLAADELQGRLFVTRVSPDGPAERAGVRAGDIVLAVGGEPVRSQAEFYRKVWATGSAGVEIPLRMLQGVDARDLRVRSIDRVEYFRPKQAL